VALDHPSGPGAQARPADPARPEAPVGQWVRDASLGGTGHHPARPSRPSPSSGTSSSTSGSVPQRWLPPRRAGSVRSVHTGWAVLFVRSSRHRTAR